MKLSLFFPYLVLPMLDSLLAQQFSLGFLKRNNNNNNDDNNNDNNNNNNNNNEQN